MRAAALRDDVAVSNRPAVAVEQAVSFDHVSLAFDDNAVLDDVSFSLPVGRMTFLLGSSGSGKSTILKLILGLLKPDAGIIHVNGARIDNMSESQLMVIRGDIGMLFQESALFDSLTVSENVGYRLDEETDMPDDEIQRRVEEVLGFVGLREYLERMPSELSGGQRRRVAIARAMAAQPRLLLFDDPTSGLDPITARSVIDEIIKLRDAHHVTPIFVTHQLPDAFYVATHEAVRRNGGYAIVAAGEAKRAEAQFIVLRSGRVHFDGDAATLKRTTDSYLLAFLSGWIPPLI